MHHHRGPALVVGVGACFGQLILSCALFMELSPERPPRLRS